MIYIYIYCILYIVYYISLLHERINFLSYKSRLCLLHTGYNVLNDKQTHFKLNDENKAYLDFFKSFLFPRF